MRVQAATQESVQKRAELDAFERHNVGLASSRTTDAIARQGEIDVAQESKRARVESSGHAIQMNAERAQGVQVRLVRCWCTARVADVDQSNLIVKSPRRFLVFSSHHRQRSRIDPCILRAVFLAAARHTRLRHKTGQADSGCAVSCVRREAAIEGSYTRQVHGRA